MNVKDRFRCVRAMMVLLLSCDALMRLLHARNVFSFALVVSIPALFMLAVL